jgi:hypothetical protein
MAFIPLGRLKNLRIMYLACLLGAIVSPQEKALASSFYEQGYRMAKGLSPSYALVAKSLKEEAGQDSWVRALAMAQRHQATLTEYFPEQLERLRGMSMALSIDPVEAIALSMFLNKGQQCAQGASAPPATKDNQVYLTWNFETLMAARPLFILPLFSIVENPGVYKFCFLGLPYFFGVPLMNEKGLSLSAASMTINEDGEGLTPFELAVFVMERAANVNEAVEISRTMPRYSTSDIYWGNWMNWSFTLADAEDNVATVEMTTSLFEAITPANKIVARANHYDYLPDEMTTCYPLAPQYSKDEATACFGSRMRASRMWSLLEDNYGNINLELAKTFPADIHGGETFMGRPSGTWWTIERHSYTIPRDQYVWNDVPYNPTSDISYVIEQFNLVYEPKRRILWWASGHASRGYFTPIFLAPYFGVEGPTIDSYTGPQKNYARVLNSWVKVSDEIFGLADVLLGLGARTAEILGYTAGIEPNAGSVALGAFRPHGSETQSTPE